MIYGVLVAGAITLATLSRYSLAQTATLTSLAFFLSSSFTTAVTAAPSYNFGIVSDPSINIMETWEQPCGTPLAASLKRPPQRHSVHRALKKVRIQLRVAQNHFRKDLKVVHEIYSKVYKVLKGQYHMGWLPKNQLEWYYNELWCKEKSKKAERGLPQLHDALQRFAITFHLLKSFRLKSNINVEYTMNKRNEIISQMQNEVHRMLCEVETAILNLGLQLPEIHKTEIVTSESDWATEGDLTLMLIQDWGVLRLYQAFLNDWTRALRNATAIGPGTCDPDAVKPLLYRAKQKNPKKTKRLKPKRLAQVKKKKNENINNDNIDSNNNSTYINNYDNSYNNNNNNDNNHNNNNNHDNHNHNHNNNNNHNHNHNNNSNSNRSNHNEGVVVRNNEIIVGGNGEVIHSRRRGVRRRMAKNRRKKNRQ